MTGFDEVKKGSDSKLRLALESEIFEDVEILHCAGRITYQREAEMLSDHAVRVFLEGRHLLMDFADLQMLDSAGIGQLVLIHMRGQAAGCEVVIAAASDRIIQLVKLTNVAGLFGVYPNVECAREVLSREVA